MMSIDTKDTGVFKNRTLDSPVVFHQGRLYDVQSLYSFVQYLSETIPPHDYFLNLYEDRFYFLAAFLLALRQRSISLFPSSVNDYTIERLSENYPDLVVLNQQQENNRDIVPVVDLQACFSKWQSSHQSIDYTETKEQLSDIDEQCIVVIIFTSGSTGEPEPYQKQWRDMLNVSSHLACTILMDKSFFLEDCLPVVLATVPAQHMYGLDASIMMALQYGLVIVSEKPFFPQDIVLALEQLNQQAVQLKQQLACLLITTPLHLQACIKTGVQLNGIREIISATAPLTVELAKVCEQNYATVIIELFGCTEVGSMAWRRTTSTEPWAVFEDIVLQQLESEILIKTTRSIEQFNFNDEVELLDAHHFVFRGRKSDAVSRAGKRSSLAYLNSHLLSFPELQDGCYYQDVDHPEGHLSAFLVSGNKIPDSAQQKQIVKALREHLKKRIDLVFLPKKIYFVDKLPRNSTGKLPLKAMQKLIAQQGH